MPLSDVPCNVSASPRYAMGPFLLPHAAAGTTRPRLRRRGMKGMRQKYLACVWPKNNKMSAREVG
eukprot:scaffold4284_cov113-Isochrysis_galbana.AAC.12